MTPGPRSLRSALQAHAFAAYVGRGAERARRSLV